MKALIEVMHHDRQKIREFVLVDRVQDDDQLWEVMDKLRDQTLCCVRLIWAGLSPREYTASEILQNKKSS